MTPVLNTASLTSPGNDSVDPAAELPGRLLESAARLSYDPAVEVDWDADLDPTRHGLNPQWSTLFDTTLWRELSPRQQVTLTRHEVCSIMSIGIWFEMILQQMVLRDQYCANYADPKFQFALTEVADECRHSIMFARACQKMGITAYLPRRGSIALGRGFKTLASNETAYGAILVAEEVLDVMQRDWMRGEDVLPLVRATSRIHVVEESRHMTFARQQMREAMRGIGPARRFRSGTIIAIAAYEIISNMVNKDVYLAAGLDGDRAVAEARANAHHHAMMRTGSQHLMSFLDDCGLLSRPAVAIYRRLHLL